MSSSRRSRTSRTPASSRSNAVTVTPGSAPGTTCLPFPEEGVRSVELRAGSSPSPTCGGGSGRGLSGAPRGVAIEAFRSGWSFVDSKGPRTRQAPPSQPSPASGRGSAPADAKASVAEATLPSPASGRGSAAAGAKACAAEATVPSPACGGGLGRGLSDVSRAIATVAGATDFCAKLKGPRTRQAPLPSPPPQAGEGAKPRRRW